MSSGLKVLLAEGDLMAQARLESAAATAGASIETVAGMGLLERLRRSVPDILVLDLDRGGQPLIEAVAAARAEGITLGRVLGYLSHVDKQLAEAAEAVGCEAIPRGRFWRTLPNLLAGQDAAG